MLSDDLLNSGAPSNSDVSPSPRTWRGPLSSRRARRRSIVGGFLSATLVGAALLSTPSATAAPTPSLKEVEKRIEKLHEQQEQASEDFNTTRELLKSVDVRLKASDDKLARLRVELKKTKLQVGRLASETYRRGELSTLSLVLGDNPDAALAQAGYLPTLSTRQADAMARLKEGEAKLAATQADIKAQQKKAEAARANLKKTRKLVEKRLEQANRELNRLEASDRASLTQSLRGSSGPGGSASCNGKSVNSASAAGRTAIQFACGQLGDQYVWAGDGPDTWDCSGLTMKAFAAAGVSLPHSSKLQAGYGTPISVANMAAGDLIFFNSPITHVSIYLGNNQMVHAPNSSTVVKVQTLYDTPSKVVRL